MPIPFEGGCHCGSVRYVCSEEPITVVNCHCGDCQKIAGSAFITGVLVPEGSVEINGEMKSYRVEADSGNHITRNFCPACGTRILVELEGVEPSLLYLNRRIKIKSNHSAPKLRLPTQQGALLIVLNVLSFS